MKVYNWVFWSATAGVGFALVMAIYTAAQHKKAQEAMPESLQSTTTPAVPSY
jgi:hypothetical protein